MLAYTVRAAHLTGGGFFVSRFGSVRFGSFTSWAAGHGNPSWSELFPAPRSFAWALAGSLVTSLSLLFIDILCDAMRCHAMQQCFSFGPVKIGLGVGGHGMGKGTAWLGRNGMDWGGRSIILSLVVFRGKNGHGKEGKRERKKDRQRKFKLSLYMYVCKHRDLGMEGVASDACERDCTYGLLLCCLACDVVVVIVIVELTEALRIKSTRYQKPNPETRYQVPVPSTRHLNANAISRS